MSENTQVAGRHSMEFLEPTWLRVTFPFPDQLPPMDDIVIPQDTDFYDRKSHWAYNSETLGPFYQNAGPPPGYNDQPILVQYHPLHSLFDDRGEYINDRELSLICEHTVEASTFEQQSLWAAYEHAGQDNKLELSYRAVMQFLKTPDGGWVRAEWVGNMAPSVRNMGWMIGGLALGGSVIGPDAVLWTGKLADSRLHGTTSVKIEGGVVAQSTLKNATVEESSMIYSSVITDSRIKRAELRHTISSGEIDIEGISISGLQIQGNGFLRGSGKLTPTNYNRVPDTIDIGGDLEIQPVQQNIPDKVLSLHL